MARIRSIRPEFWEDEEISLLSIPARLLYIATWNAADDEGLLRWTPAYIKSVAFVYDDFMDVDAVAALMSELEDAGKVHPYRGGKAQQRLGWIVSFGKSQRPNRPQPSKLPPPSLQNPQVRNAYADRDGWICGICNGDINPLAGHRNNPYDDDSAGGVSGRLTLDHVTPRSKGGSDYPSNIVAAHGGCNSGKKDSLPDSLPDSLNDADPTCDPLHAVGESRGEEGRGAGAGGEGPGGEPTGHRTAVAPPAAAAAPPDHEAMLLAAVDLLLTRDGTTAEAQTKRNPNRWLASARRGRADDHREHAALLLEDDPTLDAGRLAELLEPADQQIKPDRANPHVPTWEETQARQAAEAAETNLSAEERAAAVAAVKAAATKLKEHR